MKKTRTRRPGARRPDAPLWSACLCLSVNPPRASPGSGTRMLQDGLPSGHSNFYWAGCTPPLTQHGPGLPRPCPPHAAPGVRQGTLRSLARPPVCPDVEGQGRVLCTGCRGDACDAHGKSSDSEKDRKVTMSPRRQVAAHRILHVHTLRVEAEPPGHSGVTGSGASLRRSRDSVLSGRFRARA